MHVRRGRRRTIAFVVRALIVASIAVWIVVFPHAAAEETLSVLHIKVVLTDAQGKGTPVPDHALLISANPSTAPPRMIRTSLDGTANVKLRPGSYTVESDRPIAFAGKAYEWTQTVEVVAGRDAVLELTAANADVGPAGSLTASDAPPAADASSLLIQWQDSVVSLWTQTAHASGFVADLKGLVATSQRAIGSATSVEVQLTPSVKVAGRVVSANAARDVAFIQIDPQVLDPARPVPMACGQPPAAVAEGQRLFTIVAPLRGEKSVESGTTGRVDAHAFASDLLLPAGSAGSPVFSASGSLIGITTLADDRDERSRASQAVRIEEVCDLIAPARVKMNDGGAPDRAHLPVEPPARLTAEALTDAVSHRGGALLPYAMSSSDFNVGFITPVMIYGAQYQMEQARQRERGKGVRTSIAEPESLRQLMDFGYWSEYVAAIPPVLLVRATPRQVEGFWTTLARGAARTQGMNVPAITHFKSGFSRMRVFCGDAEIVPIHPFKIERRVSERDAIYEGLYVFDPSALGPQCGTVRLVLYSEKEAEKGDTRVIDPRIIQQIRDDFAPSGR